MLYLIRHAHALDGDDDASRPLSKRGVQQARDLADFLGRSDRFEPNEIWHSSLVRARETAELLAESLKLAAPLSTMPDLQPEDDPRVAVRRIKAIPHSLVVVGHEPHLSAVASLLVAGKASPPVFVMKKCAALALEGGGAYWAVRWHVYPDLIA